MKTLKIMTDASCDFPQELVERYNVEIIPLNVSMGDENYVYGAEVEGEKLIDIRDFYERMPKMDELTQVPSSRFHTSPLQPHTPASLQSKPLD